MPATTISSREFNQEVSRAKKAAQRGPVIITDRGKPAHVLLSFREYERLKRPRRSIVEILALPDAKDVELPIPASREMPRAADFS